MNRRAPILITAILLTSITAAEAAAADQPPPLYKIDTLAGAAFTGDGRPASVAVFLQPQCVATDRAGNIYISDTGDHRVRRIGTDGLVRTVAGTGMPGYRGDGGPATQAQLNAPYGMAVDSTGNLYIADLGNAVIRRITPDGVIQTWAGGGRDPLSTGLVAPAKTVQLLQPRDVAVDRAGNLIVADFGGHRVYSVTPGGSIATIAGTGEPGAVAGAGLNDARKAALSYPAAVAIDVDGAILVADSGNRRLRRVAFGNIWTVTDRNKREIEFGTPTGIATDPSGRIYVADGSPLRTAVISPAGDLTLAAVASSSVALTPLLDLIAVSGRRVRKLSGSRTEVIAGQGAGDGRLTSDWRFSQPSAAVRDLTGALWIADTGLGRIRRLNASATELSTVVTALDSPVSLAVDSAGRVWAGDRSGNGGIWRVDVPIPQALIEGQNRPLVPTAMAFDPDNALYVADAANNLIRRVTSAGSMTVLAGGGRDTGDGQGLQLKLNAPAGVAVDLSGAVWFTESGSGKLRKIVGGRVTTLAGPELIEPRGIRFDRAGKLWVADAGAHRIVVVDTATGNWYPVAGSADKGFSGDAGFALAAMLNGPTDVWPEPDGSALIVDTGNDRLRRIEKVQNEPEKPVVTPPSTASPITLSPIRVLHVATRQESDVAPGQLAWIEGKDLTSPEVTISGAPVQILEATSSRLTIQIPALAAGWVEVAVKSAGQLYGKTALRIIPSVPGILTVADGKGQALAVNADGQVNGPDHPAERGSVISLFLTGDGGLAPNSFADIAGYQAEILWAGPAPTLIGVTQANIQTPGGFAPSGTVPITLGFDALRTQPGVTIVSR